jgi:hypothetical protein
MRQFKRSIPTFVLIILMACPGLFAQTRQITSFDSLTKALFAGERVRMVIHYAQCKLTDEGKVQEKSPDAVTGIDVGTFEYFAAGVIPNMPAFLTFTETKLIRNPKGKGYVNNYGKIRVLSDNSVVVIAQYLEPKKLSVLMDERFDGIINDGKNQGGVYFYVTRN